MILLIIFCIYLHLASGIFVSLRENSKCYGDLRVEKKAFRKSVFLVLGCLLCSRAGSDDGGTSRHGSSRSLYPFHRNTARPLGASLCPSAFFR